jgi:hypothetical protein
MKKMFFVMMAGLMVLASCKKDKNPQYPFDHLQWITEEMDGCDLSDYGIDDCAKLPEGKLLMDVGATKEDKGYLAWVVTSSDERYSSGDIVLIDEGSYGYNPVTGSFSFPGFDDAMVSFISETKVKVDYDGTATVFELATKNYKVKNAIDPLPAGPTAFTITHDKPNGEFAGGQVEFTANKPVDSWKYEVVTEDLAVSASCMTSINDGVLSLGSYRPAASTGVASAQIKVTATSGEETAEATVWCWGWEPAIFECADGASTCKYVASGSYLQPLEQWRVADEIICLRMWDHNETYITDPGFLSKLEVTAAAPGADVSSKGSDGGHFQFGLQTQGPASLEIVVKYGNLTYMFSNIAVVD